MARLGCARLEPCRLGCMIADSPVTNEALPACLAITCLLLHVMMLAMMDLSTLQEIALRMKAGTYLHSKAPCGLPYPSSLQILQGNTRLPRSC